MASPEGRKYCGARNACRISRTRCGHARLGKDNGERAFFTTLGYNLLRRAIG
jgi:hypothetical protein